MSTKTFSDYEIIAGLQQPTPESRLFEDALYLRYSYFIQEGIKKFSLQYEDAFSSYSDAVINVLYNVRNGHFEGRSSLKTYLYQVFHNKCVDQVRKNATNKSEVHRSAFIPEMLTTLTDTAKTIIQQLVERADIEDLKQRLQEIGENCRQMLLLSAEGYSDKEIAMTMKFKTAGVAKTSRLRCMEKLRRYYIKRN